MLRLFDSNITKNASLCRDKFISCKINTILTKTATAFRALSIAFFYFLTHNTG
jgi:hypothetical protein